MRKYLYVFSGLAFLSLILYNCNNLKSKPAEQSNQIANADSQKVVVTCDASLNHLVSDSDFFYAVFEISQQTQAIVFETEPDYPQNKFDSLMQYITRSKVFYAEDMELKPLKGIVDSSGPFVLVQSAEISEKLEEFLEGEFFIYCTKGVVKRKMKSVLFSANMCQSSIFALQFDRIDPVKWGRPLMASRKNSLVSYSDSSVQQLIKNFNDSLITRDYTDTLTPQIFARKDSVLFVYYDDFLWPYMVRDKHCFFPARVQYIIRPGNEVFMKDWNGLDLFGVPCD